MFFEKDSFENIINDHLNEDIYFKKDTFSPKKSKIIKLKCNKVVKLFIIIFSIQFLFYIILKFV